jgi:phospholipid transport system substrate-binding protein
MRNKIINVFAPFLLLLVMLSSTVLAAGAAVDTVRLVSNQVIDALRADETTLQSNPEVVYRIVNQYLLPHVDLMGMARSVVPRNVWMSATPAEREQFTRQFSTLLIRTYSAALAKYTNQSIEFPPSRGSNSDVMSRIIRNDGPSIEVDYQMVMIGGKWKLHDFSVEGISMLESFRSQFAEDSNQGLAQLTAKLAQHNGNNSP